MGILVCIVPGLGSESLNPADLATVPKWCQDLRDKIMIAVPAAEVIFRNYTQRDLPEELAAKANGRPVIFGGHSDGGACGVWVADHAKRKSLSLILSILILLDVVTDLVRHGPLAKIPAANVRRCIRIYQTADTIIHSNDVSFDDPSKPIEEYTMAEFGEPGALHIDVSDSDAVQVFIANAIARVIA